MASLGQLTAQLRLDGASPMMAGLRGVGGAASGLAGTLASLQGPLALLGVSFGAFKSAQGITETLKGIFATGRELQTLSRTTGQSVRDLVVLQKTFGAAGLSAEEVPGSLRLLQRALGGVNEEGQPTSQIFSRLHLSMQQLKGESAIQQLTEVGAAIRKLPDQASQAAAAMQVFGRSGADMLAVFADPALLDNMAKSAGGTAEIFQRGAATFAKISADLSIIGGKTKGFFVGVADQIAPVLLPLLDKLKAVDLVPLGQQAGRAIKVIAAAFEQGHAGELFGASLELGIGKAMNYLVGMMGPAAHALASLLGGEIDGLSDSLGAMVDGICGLLEAGLMRAFTQPIKYMQAAVEHLMQLRDLKRATDEGKHIDYGRFADMTPDTLRQRIAQTEHRLQNLSNSPNSNTELGIQLARLKAFQADPSQFVRPLESVAEIMARHASESVRVGLGNGQTADELTADSRAKLQSASAGLAKNLGDITGTFAKAFRDFHPANVVDVGASGARLAALMSQLKGVVDSAAGTPVKLGGAGLSLAGNVKAVEGDRLARIGGFVGSGGPALDFARRTAVAAEKTSQGIQTLLHQYAGADKGQLAARWAA